MTNELLATGPQPWALIQSEYSESHRIYAKCRMDSDPARILIHCAVPRIRCAAHRRAEPKQSFPAFPHAPTGCALHLLILPSTSFPLNFVLF